MNIATNSLGRRAAVALLAAVIIAGLAISLLNVKRTRQLFDVDEAAWIFNGYYLDLYLFGDWKNPDWRAFEKYAQHPPGTAYVFGALLHAIGEPMRSMEPRRFWFENDMNLILDPPKFFKGLYERLSYRQVIAGRYMSAAFAWMTAAAVMLLAYRLTRSPIGAVVAFVLFIFHPLVMSVGTLAAGDTFIMFASVLAIILSMEIAIRKRWWLLWPTLAAAMGVAFASKISSYALIPPAAAVAIAISEDKRIAVRNAALVCLAAAAAFGVACILDPGLHASPISATIERFYWRMDRVGIQKIVFVDQYLGSVADRISFCLHHLFFSSASAMIFIGLSIAGIVRGLRMGQGRRPAICAIFLFAYFLILTVAFTPMAWTRYVAAYLPFMMILPALGVEAICEGIRHGAVKKGSLTAAAVVLAVLIVIGWASNLRWRGNQPLADRYHRNIAMLFAFSQMYPGGDGAVHETLFRYFDAMGERQRADREMEILQKMAIR